MANDKILEVENLSVSFNTYAGEVKAVRGVSFNLAPGETLAFVGESGCGKSVTAKSLLRLLKPPFAVIKEELCAFRGDEISMIFQDPMTSLNPTMTVGKQIMESLRIHRHMNKKEAREEAIKMLKMVNIPSPEKRIDSYPHEMSGGMRLQPEGSDCRRADHCAGRDHSGADHGPDARAERKDEHRNHSGYP